MRKLKLQMQLSLDGYVAGPKGEMDWMMWNWDDQIKDYITALTEPVDCILLGSHMPEGFVGHWKAITANPADPQFPFAKKMYDTPKVVFSKKLEKSTWDNTVVAKGDISEEVNKLKTQPGKDIIAYGGANFASNLIKYNLIDEYYLFVNPVIIGDGMPIFKEIIQKRNLKLVQAIPFSCGIVVLHYRPE